MDFSNALKMLKMGVPMTRLAWDDPRATMSLVDEAVIVKTMKHFDYDEIPYSMDNEDILADDWEVTRSN